MNFSNYRFFLFNTFNNSVKSFHQNITIMKTSLSINFINHINWLRKIIDKQILPYSFFDNLCKLLKKIC